MNSENAILLRYILVHEDNDIVDKLNALLKEALELENISDIESITNLAIDTIKLSNGMFLSRMNLTFYNPDYSNVIRFEEYINDEDGIKISVKVYDSYKLAENQSFLVELYEMEMKIREIFSVVMYTQDAKFEWSMVNPKKDFQENPDEHRKRMMNEFFFIEFSDYKNIDYKKEVKFSDLLKIFNNINDINHLLPQVQELLQPTLGLKERFDALGRIPEAISRLESFRNAIAHNRYLSSKDIENFNKAKEIIQEVYDTYDAKFKNMEL